MANIVIRPYQLNVAPGGVETVVNLSQYENGRELVFHLVGEGQIVIPAGSTAIIAGTKPDDTIYSAVGYVDADENTVTFQENVQMSAAAGKWYAKVKVTASGQTVASGMVKFVVEKDVIPPEAEQSSSDIQGLIAEAAQYAEDARNSFANDARTMEFHELTTTDQTIIDALNELDDDTNALDSSVTALEALTFPNLPALTATSDTDLIHVNSGGTDYKQEKSDFLQGSLAHTFGNTSSLTSQVDALTVGNYFGTISSYGHQVETDVPSNTNYYVNAFVYAGTTYRKILLHTLNSDTFYIRYKYSDGSWGAWVEAPTRSEITSLNSSLTNSYSVTELVNERGIPTTVTSYAGDWSNYRLLIIVQQFYTNVMNSIVVPNAYMASTNSQNRVLLYTPGGDKSWEIYKNGDHNFYIKASTSDAQNGVRIFGYGKIS